MKVIRIESIQNPNTKHLFLRTMETAHLANCPGKYEPGNGVIELKPWSDKVMANLKKGLEELKIKFTEE